MKRTILLYKCINMYIRRIPKMKKFLFITCDFPTNCLYLFVWNVFKWFHEKQKFWRTCKINFKRFGNFRSSYSSVFLSPLSSFECNNCCHLIFFCHSRLFKGKKVKYPIRNWIFNWYFWIPKWNCTIWSWHIMLFWLKYHQSFFIVIVICLTKLSM